MIKKISIMLMFIVSCASPNEISPAKDFRANMRDAQKLSTELFSFVWNKRSFENRQNEERIRFLLNELGNDFHQIQKTGSSLELEPGFHVILNTQQDLLKDISTRFEQGNKDYALWRLKGMTQNCIACHSRLNVPYDFFGDVKVKQVEGRFAEAEFLFASRKFDLASSKFLEFAKKDKNPDQVFLALKYWILIELRVKGRLTELKHTLIENSNLKSLKKEQKEAISHWIKDLDNIEEIKIDSLLSLPKVLDTVNDVEKEYLSNVAHSSSIHSFLDSNPLSIKRKRAILNLGVIYSNLSLPSFAVFGPMYLEQVIREFPKTKEAKLAFNIYKKELELEFTGSTGVNLDETQELKLNKLRKLAGL